MHASTRGQRHNRLTAAIVLGLCVGMGTVAYTPKAAAQAAEVKRYDLPAGTLDEALAQFGRQSGLQMLVPPELVAGHLVEAISGEFTNAAALERLLRGTGLSWERIPSGAVVIRKASAKPAEAAKPKPRAEPAAQEEKVTNMPAIMVTGTKTLNMDITRTEDDPQPYVVFDREQIERSGATSLEQFLQQRLTMNTSAANAGAGVTGGGIATSQITLRGLSAAQTLILIDGHRVSSPAFSSASGQGALSQADISGLPLGAIERIEVLPTTASGIYGGSATGGAINIILRRDYTGGELKFTYDNSFDSDTGGRKVDVTFGHNFNEGKTSLLIIANYAEANNLLLGDRRLAQRGREAIWSNNPGYFLGPSGFPPLGATPNIVSADGSDLVLKDGTPLSAAFTSVPEGYAGTRSDGGAALVLNAGGYNWELANTSQVSSSSGGSRQALYTQPRVKAGTLALRHQVNDRLQVFTDLSSSKSLSRFPASLVASGYLIPASSPTNPFSQNIRVTVSLPGGQSDYSTTIEHHRALAGLVQKLPRDWLLGADYTWDRTTVTNNSPNSALAFADAVTSGAIDALRDTDAYPIDLAPYIRKGDFTSPFRSTMTDANLRVSGPVGSLPGGSPILSASVAYRDETVTDAFWSSPVSDANFYFPERSQTVSSTYLELLMPLFSGRNDRPGLRELDLQIAVRRDHYISRSAEQLIFFGDMPSPSPKVVRSRNAFTSVDSTVALLWKPWSSLALRASYGTGFLPPALNQLVPTIRPTPVTRGSDPLRGNTPAGPFTLISGGNADLNPEQSKSWSTGLILTPTALPNWRISVDYTKIEKIDNIDTHPNGFQGLIDDEALFPDRVTRGPNLPGDPPGWAGPITLIDNSVLNLASAKLEVWDVQVDVRKEAGQFGAFNLFFVGTWQPHYKTRTLKNQPEIENAGVSFLNPLKFKANAGVTWMHTAWRTGWNVNHFHGYKVSFSDQFIINQGDGGRVPSQTYHDVFVHYDFGLATGSISSWLAGIEIQFGVRNIFDKAPPRDAFSNVGFYSRFSDPRLRTYYLAVTKRF